MYTKIPTAFAVGCGVGDIRATIRPLDLITLALHQFNELLLVDGIFHALVDLNGESHLPALAAHRRVILRLPDARGLLLLRLANGQAVTHTDLI